MKKSQNTTAYILMLASVLLLAASQYFWLKSEYKDQKRAFYTHSNLLFKETVRSLEDSLLSRSIVISIKRSELDTLYLHDENKNHKVTIERVDIGKNVTAKEITKPKLTVKSAKLISPDSLRKTRRVLAQLPHITIQEKPSSKRNESSWFRRGFEFRSASLDSVENKFNKRVSEIGYKVSFDIKKDSIPFDTVNYRSFRRFSEMHKMLNSSDDSVSVNGVSILNPEKITAYSILPNVMFEADPKNLERYLLSKLTSNFLFSCFLFLITGLAFYFIYRNLQRQTRLNLLKNDLISNVSHELKTPLATLSVALEALLQFGGKENPEITKEYLTISRNEVSRLSLMVDNILRASLLEKESIYVDSEPLNIKDLLEEVVQGWQLRIQQLGGSITLNTSGENFMLNADQVQIGGVISNLIDNAVKYSNGIPNVKISLIETFQQLVIRVEDNGIGIPKEYQSQVFEKFFRVPTGDKHNVKGYGLGLNFVKHIMALHHGEVSLKSGDEGTEFKLTFNRSV